MSALPNRIPAAPLFRVGEASWRYVTIDEAARRTGYTVDAINGKIDKGVWKEGREWRMAPDGRRLVDRDGYEAWVEAGRPGDSE